MTFLLAVDGLPYRLLSGWVALLRATVVWLVLCLPIVTVPAATVVLLRSADRIMSGQTAPSLADSVTLVRGQFWSALRLAGLVGLGSLIVVSAIVGPSPGGLFDVLLPIVVIPVAASWILACQWVFAVLEERPYGAWEALRHSYLRALRRPDLAAASALGTVALPAVGLLLPTAVWLPYWLTVPSLWAALVIATFRRAPAATRAGSPCPEKEFS